jgi:1,2-diacylglycerol 3-alpha-glucosyltransferase
MFTDSYFPTIDGVVVSLTSTSQELKKQGHEVVVFAPEPTGGSVDYLPDRVIWLPAFGFREYETYRSALFPSSIVSLVRSEQPDIIHSHGIGFMGLQALIASRQTKIRNVLTYHTLLHEAADHYAPPIMPVDVMVRLAWFYQKSFLKRPHAVITPTRAIRDELEGYGIRARRWEAIATGVDCERFSPNVSGKEVRDKYGLDDCQMILTVGRVAKEKNLELLLAGFKELINKEKCAKLLIVGKGPAMEEYQNLTKEMNLDQNVVFTGFIPDSQLASYYAACDAFAIASKFETQGIAAVEAMASGKPIAGMRSKALPEIIREGENGYLFDDDQKSCADALDRAINDRSDVSAGARRTGLEFSLDKCTAKLVDLYKHLHDAEDA